MPIVTQSRTIPGRQHRATFRQVGFPTDPVRLCDVAYSHPSDQTTTSYRSEKRTTGEDREYESASGEELRRGIRKEYQTRYDNGHNFNTLRHTYEDPHGPFTWRVPVDSKGTYWIHTGDVSFVITGSAGTFPSISIPSGSQINQDGAIGINRTLPTTPEANLFAILGELRQRLPQFIGAGTANSALSQIETSRRWKEGFAPTVIKRGGASSRNIGDEYLNVQFGLLPTASDLQSLARGIADFSVETRNLQARAREYKIRRRVQLGEEKSFSVVSGDSFIPGIGLFGGQNYKSFFWNGNGTYSTTDNYVSRKWFSGAYTYHLSEGINFLGKLGKYEQLANELLGTHLSADAVWQLTPWSWVIDWFYDVGSFIQNLSTLAGDNLVLRYGYVMHHTKCVRERRVRGLLPKQTTYGPSTVPKGFAGFATTESKIRTGATPYGFGVDMASLSARRVAILGALGLTKAPKIPFM